MTALRSEVISGGRKVSNCISKTILVFNADGMKNTSINGCGLIFRCKNFSVDEDSSSCDWKNAFEYRIENGDMVVVTINPDFNRPAVIMPYFE
jgi:hypothetical protein